MTWERLIPRIFHYSSLLQFSGSSGLVTVSRLGSGQAEMLPLRWSKQNRIKLLRRVEGTVNNINFFLIAALHLWQLTCCAGASFWFRHVPISQWLLVTWKELVLFSSILLSSFGWILEFCAGFFSSLWKCLGRENQSLCRTPVPWSCSLAGCFSGLVAFRLLCDKAGCDLCPTTCCLFLAQGWSCSCCLCGLCWNSSWGSADISQSCVPDWFPGLGGTARALQGHAGCSLMFLAEPGMRGGLSTLGKHFASVVLSVVLPLHTRDWGNAALVVWVPCSREWGSYLFSNCYLDATAIPGALGFFCKPFLHLTFCLRILDLVL